MQACISQAKEWASKQTIPPALTAGLTVFLTFLYLLNFVLPVNDTLKLSPSSLTSINLNQISLYPLAHMSIFHLVFNLFALVPMLSNFEKLNGTVRTGIVLNVLAVVTAIPYCILGLVFYPNTSVLGASGWVFSFAAYFAHKQSLREPGIAITPTFSIPTLFTPLIALIVIWILIPGSSFMGHFLGAAAGYAMSFGFLNLLIEPSGPVVEKIESKIGRLIALIPPMFHFYREVEVKDTRPQNIKRVELPGKPIVGASMGSLLPTAETNPNFSGPGNVVGSA